MKNRRFPLFSSSLAASLVMLSPSLHAAAITWDAGGANNNWSTINNWSDNAAATGDDVTFNATGAATSGVTNTVDASISIASLTYGFESSTLQHTTAIAAGQTLAVTGNFLLAGSTTAATPTNVTLTGSTGALTVGGTSFQVGQSGPTSNTTSSRLDMSGLGTFTANLGAAGTFRIGPNTTGTTGPEVTAKLAATSTITANTFGVGDRSGRGGTHTLILGSVANTINANTISVGTNSGRANGELLFETGTGTLKIRAADGTSAATMDLINNGFGTANNVSGIANFAGHSVDAKIGTLTMGRRVSTTTASATSTFTFDTGTLEVATLNLAQNGSGTSTAGTIVATMNIGGGNASFDTITMASSIGGAATTTTAALNLTGGTTTVNGNIARGGGSGPASATVKLDGGTLDMTDGNIGSATNAIALTLASGTLKNVAQFNGGADLTKTGSGNLVLSGANTFTGGMNMFGGEVKITDSGSFGIGTKNLNIQVGAYVKLDGTAGDITLASGIGMTTAGLSLLNSAGNNTINGNISIIAGSGITEATSDGGSLVLAGGVSNGTTATRALQLSGTSTGANTVSGAISNGSGTINVLKSGGGTWALTNGSNAYTGNTTINGGRLVLGTTATITSSSKIIVGDSGSSGAVLDVSAKTGGFTIGATQTLSGIGTVDANDAGTFRTVTIQGTHAVGNSAGSQTVDGNLSYAAGSIFEWDLAANKDTNDGGDAGTDYDAVTVTGTLDIASAAIFKVIQNNGADFGNAFWTSSQSWSNIFNVSGTSNSLWSNTAVAVYNTSNVLQDVSSYGSFAITGTTLSWSAVPEPSTSFAGILLALGIMRRRRGK